jgi:hypothetical protein
MTRRVCQFAILVLLAAGGCTSEIGDSCGYDVDCSPNMDRNCDRNQPGGYCLILGCEPDICPGEAVCVEFTTPCPDGTASETCEQIEENRARTYCLRHCKNDKGCRSKYECLLPEGNTVEGSAYSLPLLEYATIIDLDYNPGKKWGVCVPEI